MTSTLLDIQGLSVRLPHLAKRPLLDGISLRVERGEAVGLVGESGSGKSVTARAVQGLMPARAETDGRVLVDGVDVLTAGRDVVRSLRTTKVSMVFQDPRAGINPLRRIGDFLTEQARLCRGVSRGDATAQALELLAAVGLPDPGRHLQQHPHELSGGMLQRVMIASALMSKPELLLCDEPTTALDVTTQAEILAILGRLQREQNMGMLFITHDLDLASAMCDRVYVMYAGRVVEQAGAKELFAAPQHPYTAGLLASTPGVDHGHERLIPVRGAPLSLLDDPGGCAFASRCDFAMDRCLTEVPRLRETDDHTVRCLRSGELADELELRTGRGAS